MRNFAKSAILIGIICACAFAGILDRPAGAAEQDQAVLKADHGFLEALAKGDKAAVGALLDSNFEWTNADGETRNRAESLEKLTAIAADNQADTDVKRHHYGRLDLIFGHHGEVWFSRTWVKRPAGWRILVDIDTPILAESSARATARSNRGSAGDCINPCKTVPFTPTTAAEKAALTEWQKTKVDEWHPNAADWGTHVANDFLIIGGRGVYNKTERVARAKREQKAGIGLPGAPILSMTMSDFGNAVVMISRHVPYQGGKPYYNFRVFVNQDGHWPIAWSQQTTIRAAAAQSSSSAEK